MVDGGGERRHLLDNYHLLALKVEAGMKLGVTEDLGKEEREGGRKEGKEGTRRDIREKGREERKKVMN